MALDVVPSFAPEGGAVLVLARGAAVGAMLLLFGALLHAALVAPAALASAPADVAGRVRRQALALERATCAAALGALVLWCVAQAADMAGASDGPAVLAAVGPVVSGTLFGHLAVAQAVLLGAAGLAAGPSRGRRWGATCLSGAVLALQAGHGHAVAAGDPVLLGAGAVHLLAAGAWLGGLVALLTLVRAAPPRVGAMAARWFSPLGKWCVAGLVASALVQGWNLVGDVPGLVGTAYGWVAGGKAVLLGVLLGFAWANRYHLAPALLRAGAEGARRVLVRSIAVQTGFGVLAVAAAAMLTSLPPSVHEQPVWPFVLRPSLDALADPDIRQEVFLALLALAGAAGLGLVGLGWRRARWPAAAGVGLVCWLAWPHLSPLLVEAYPTSYFRSPTGFTAVAVARGAELFPQHCASCHGADGRGDGPAAKGLDIPPADLTAEHLWEHADGEMFWWLSHGIDAPEGGLAMPGFAGRLSPDQRWELIDYVRAHNAGVALRDTGTWPHPVQAPRIGLDCGGAASSTEALEGKVVHLVAAADGTVPASAPSVTVVQGVPMVTVLLTRDGRRPTGGGTACASTGPEAWDAYATLAGLTPDTLAGTQFLVDPAGWLRAEQRPGDAAPSWTDRPALLAEVRAICTHPVPGGTPSAGHAHH